MGSESSTSTRNAAIESFAQTLRDVRAKAGNPSFREMSGRSAAISHTTLHEAAQGNRLPSWATTAEFVKACGADPADFRDRWQRANDLVRSGAAPDPDPAPHQPTGTPHTPPTAAEPANPSRRRLLLLVAAVIVAVAAGTVTLVATLGGADERTPTAGPTGLLRPDDCPVRQSNPPPDPPAHRGDAAGLVTDITLPDCSHLRPGQTATKVWRFENMGTVAWRGYTLHRIDLPVRRDQCQTITDIPIADTPPGGKVDVRTEVTAPQGKGLCFVRFKLQDGAGRIAFPGNRPVYFQVVVG